MKLTICALGLGLVIAACSSDTALTTSTVTTAPTSTVTTTTVTPTTLSSKEVCLSFRDEIAPLIGQAADQMSESEQMFFDNLRLDILSDDCFQ